jgi:hypothetical protein
MAAVDELVNAFTFSIPPSLLLELLSFGKLILNENISLVVVA